MQCETNLIKSLSKISADRYFTIKLVYVSEQCLTRDKVNFMSVKFNGLFRFGDFGGKRTGRRRMQFIKTLTEHALRIYESS